MFSLFQISIIVLWLTNLAHSQGSPWFMLVGGVNSASSVTLYNWETKQICDKKSFPVPSYEASGTFLNGVPLVCGGGLLDQSACYKYQKTSNSWTKTSSLLFDIKQAASALVPNHGWHIFGANLRSQKLATIDGSWQYGVTVPAVSQHCAVQVSDTLTAIIGGSGIIRYDWSIMDYNRVTKTFKEQHVLPGCAMMTTITGERVVAVVGGEKARSMETWNPRDDSIETVTEVLPMSTSIGLPGPQVFSIQGEKQLIAFCGNPEKKNAYGEVWMYPVDINVWFKDAVLPDGKALHVAIPVDGITCN